MIRLPDYRVLCAHIAVLAVLPRYGFALVDIP
jgi:hypothetical protein